MRILVVDVGGTHIEVLATGQRSVATGNRTLLLEGADPMAAEIELHSRYGNWQVKFSASSMLPVPV